MEPALQDLIDRHAINDVIQRYARTLDWLDDEGQGTCYWPDAEVDYGFYKGRADQFLPIVMEVERGSDRRWHMLSQPLIRFHSAKSASSECYGIFAGAKRQDDGTLAGNLFGGRYLDEWEKRSEGNGEEWRISARIYLLDWQSDLTDQPGFTPDPDFPLPTAQIDQSGHPLYRRL
ncbi:nuclear transport factor 2 family protein [Erythrobacter rubeus]|uniref:Nuclear transport factor 2 family protein n=1 Tax=Erythrobacter rubeus TaxID=2760803 RepID=A0ABR8KYM8_9SPHN|nr:nuclear transport factor 2 family protein [Erythrobacter rubeus]MBD2843326.1 nuclear transport factor 2 family protein [Erythrobacter rubeus]